jgi:hypothetical protein
LINRLLVATDERTRRLLAGFVAKHLVGGVSQTALITGLDRKTIAKGVRELGDKDFPTAPSDRVRRVGGGRRRVEAKRPGL